jgi:hypothetical protein
MARFVRGGLNWNSVPARLSVIQGFNATNGMTIEPCIDGRLRDRAVLAGCRTWRMMGHSTGAEQPRIATSKPRQQACLPHPIIGDNDCPFALASIG